MALSTDFVLRTGPFDHTGKKPKDDEEGKYNSTQAQRMY
jgi:ribosome assembly protein 4